MAVILLQYPSIVIKTKLAVLNFGKRTKWTLKNLQVLSAIAIVGESRSEFMSPVSVERGKIIKTNIKQN
jgi:hypothetical protein